MAAINAADVRVGVTGTIKTAPAGTTLPTTAAVALNAAFFDLGYLTQDGLSESVDSSITDLIAWQNSAVVRRTLDSDSLSYSFTLFQTDPDTLKFYYGNYDTTVPTVGHVGYTGALGPIQPMVFDILDGAHVTRLVLPAAQLTGRGEVSYAAGGTSYPVTVTAYPDSGGVKMHRYYVVA